MTEADTYQPPERPIPTYPFLLAVIVIVTALAGILSRPTGILAAFWPANPVIMGLLIRFPRWNTSAGWLAIFLSFLAADFFTGSPWDKTLYLTLGNLVAIGAGVTLYSVLSAADKQLRRPSAVIALFVICIGMATAAGLTGIVINPILFEPEAPLLAAMRQGFELWFTSEIINSVAILPCLLTLPAIPSQPVATLKDKLHRHRRTDKNVLLPVLALGVSMALGLLIGGPGAITFPLPALLWCALTYQMFTTTLITLIYAISTLLAVSLGSLDLRVAMSEPVLVSLRLGITLITLAPTAVASAVRYRDELLKELEYVASHDDLTSILNRSTFLRHARSLMNIARQEDRPVGILMLDIDRFKNINDHYGHETGHHVLIAFCHSIRRYLRQHDLFARIGGEEFAIVLPDTDTADAQATAERLRHLVETTEIPIKDHPPLHMTVSIGGTVTQRHNIAIEQVLVHTDKALYRAKNLGRNRVEWVDLPTGDDATS